MEYISFGINALSIVLLIVLYFVYNKSINNIVEVLEEHERLLVFLLEYYVSDNPDLAEDRSIQ